MNFKVKFQKVKKKSVGIRQSEKKWISAQSLKLLHDKVSQVLLARLL